MPSGFKHHHLNKERTGIVWLWLVLLLLATPGMAQNKVSLQVKTFDQNLKALPNVQIAFNSLDFFTVGSKGTAIVEIDEKEIPVKSIKVKDERFEVGSWNSSRGVIEIIIRPVSFRIIHLSVTFADGKPAANSPVAYAGNTVISSTTDANGKVDLPVSLYERVTSAEQFHVDNLIISRMSVNGDQVSLMVEQIRKEEFVPKATAGTDKLKFDPASIDSIKSLSKFYAVFRNISMNDLNEDVRAKIDEKFRELVIQRQDSIRAAQPVYIQEISDSSLVVEDIRNLLKQATSESATLKNNRDDFESRIALISSKLQRGVVNLSTDERNTLLHDIDMLEQLLTENESQFYRNQNDYRTIINALREKYLDIQQLQTKLSEAERQQQEQEAEFRQRLLIIGTIVLLFGVMILMLITFSIRLRRQTKSLRSANERIEQINENLEEMVARRTRLLEQANRELDTFLYRASHDLRSPVVSLIGLSNISKYLERDEMVQHVQLATSNMNKVINKLVEVSEIAEQVVKVSNFKVIDIINGIRNRALDPSTGEGGLFSAKNKYNKPLQLVVDCPDELAFRSSSHLIEVILINLLENALFFAGLRKDSDVIHVELNVEVKGGKLEISVYDNGVGIPEDVRPRIFGMFVTGHEESKGNGLGLYAVSKCVTALNGTVRVESEVGKFSRFIVLIPPTESKPTNS